VAKALVGFFDKEECMLSQVLIGSMPSNFGMQKLIEKPGLGRILASIKN
jgi:hypothetical protein